jgi:hypothetical protein
MKFGMQYSYKKKKKKRQDISYQNLSNLAKACYLVYSTQHAFSVNVRLKASTSTHGTSKGLI